MVNKTQVILLAAGYGNRIANVTNDPKCLLSVHGQTLLERNFKIWHALGLTNVHIVLGYKADLIITACSVLLQQYPLNLSYSINEDFRNKGNTYSLLLGLQHCSPDFSTLIFDADLIYDQNILNSFVQDSNANQILVGDASIDDIECAKVLTDSNGYVRKTVDKRAISKEELEQYSFQGEAIGILKFDKINTQLLLQVCHDFFMLEENILKNWEHALNVFLLESNVSVHFLKHGLPWVEIDNQEDYHAALDLFTL